MPAEMWSLELLAMALLLLPARLLAFPGRARAPSTALRALHERTRPDPGRKSSSDGPSFSEQDLPNVNGLFAVYKPRGLTSNDVVTKCKIALNKGMAALTGKRQKIKVGHGGTLDPMAEGVLVLAAGDATKKLAEYLSGSKLYETVGLLGTATDTLDREGKVVETKDAAHVTRELLEASLEHFRGEIWQVPPIYSALKKDGKKLYELARAGVEVEREPRKVTVYRLRAVDHLEGCDQPIGLPHSFALEVECSGGFYVRSLVDDLARRLDTRGHIVFLRRARQGPFGLEDCLPAQDWKFSELVAHIQRSRLKTNSNPEKRAG